jgi:DNA-binding IclR family transcriptional regulator
LHDLQQAQPHERAARVQDGEPGRGQLNSSAPVEAATEPTSRTIQSVDRALGMLALLDKAGEGLLLNDFARATGLHKSTVFRLLASLQGFGLVERDGATGRYRLGLELVALSGAVLGRTEVLRIADPHLRHLADQTQETVNLGIRHRNDILNIEQIPGPHLLRSFDWLGKRTPLHLGAAAKALLANLDDDKIWAYLTARDGTPGAPDPDRLWEEVAEIRRRGIAINDGELDPNVFAIGAPLFAATGTACASLSVAGERIGFNEARITDLTELVIHTAETISRQLGYRSQRVAKLA